MQNKQKNLRLCSMVFILVMALIFGGMFCKIEADAIGVALYGPADYTTHWTDSVIRLERHYSITSISSGYTVVSNTSNWFLNDSAVASGIAHTSTFSSAGTYTIKCVVSANLQLEDGNFKIASGSASRTYKIIEPPDITANYSSYSLMCGETKQFSTNCSLDIGRTWTVTDSSNILTYTTQNGSGNNTEKYITVTGSTDPSKIGKTAKLTAKVSKTLNGTTKSDTVSIAITLVKRPVDSVTISSSEDVLFVGKTLTLTGTVSPSNASYPTITWTTSDASIATLSATTGNSVTLTGVKSGSVTITATADGVTATKTIQVKALEIICDQNWVWAGKTLSLQSKIIPDNTSTSATWTTSSASIASLSATTGNTVTLTGKAKGSATITATANGVSVTKQIEVKQPVTAIAISGDQKCWVNRTVQLTATCSPSNANDKTVTWRFFNPGCEPYASISETGLVTGLNADSDGAYDVVIEASANDGQGASMLHGITIYQQVENITLTAAKNWIYVGETLQINSVISPSNAYNQQLEWTSSNNSVAKVDGCGRVTGLKAAESVTITAHATDDYRDSSGNTITQSITFRVYNHATDVNISNSMIELFTRGEPFKKALSAYATPLPLINLRDSRIIWASQNTNLVSIVEGQNYIGDSYTNDNDATISLIPNAIGNLGTTTITATSIENSDAVASCSVELVGFKLNLESMEAFVGGQCNLIALKTTALYTMGMEYDNVTWSITSGEDVVSLTEKEGARTTVTALKVGKATITATATASNTVSASCTITVNNFEVNSAVNSIFASRADANNPESVLLSATYNNAPFAVNWEIIEGKEYATLSETENSKTTVLTAISTGGATTRTVKVRATSISADGNGPMEIDITIKQPINEISLTKEEINMFTGTSYTFVNTVVKPTNPHNDKLNWKVDGGNVSLKTADSKGHSVTLTANDDAINGASLIAFANDGRGATASTTLNVRKLLLNDSDITLYLGNKFTLQAFYTLSTVGARKPQNVEWKIESGADLISLSTTAGSSTIISTNNEQKTGTAIISATATEDTTASIQCTVIIKALDILTDRDYIYVKTDNTPANKYQMQASAKIETENVDVQWSSLDTSIATIDSKTGLITGVGTKGNKSATVKIKATMEDGSYATKSIEVRQQVTDVSIYANNKPTTELVIYKGTTVDISAKTLPEYAYDPSLSWQETENVTLSKVSSNSDEIVTVTGNKAGTAKIQVMATDGVVSNASTECTVLVKELSLSHTTLSVYAGGTATLKAFSTIEETVPQNVRWSVKDNTIVSVDSVGEEVTVKGLKQGETVITATTTDGIKNVSVSCVVQVKTIEIMADKTTIYVNNPNTDLNDYTATLKAVVDGKPISCYWSISDSTVASIDESEDIAVETVRVTGLDSQTAKATVVVTAVCDDAELTNQGTASIILTIVQQPYTVEATESSLILYKGTSYNTSVKLTPEYAYNKNVTWELTSGSDVVSVSPQGLNATINAQNSGSAVIKVSAVEDKGATDTTINVVVKELSLSDEKITLFMGKTYTLTAMIDGAESPVNWAVEDPEIAAIDSNHNSSVTVAGIGKGETTIHATTIDGNTNVTKSVKVIVRNVVVEAPITTMYVGETISLTAKIDGAEEPVYWSSSNELIATVGTRNSSNVVVTGVSKGEVIIYASLTAIETEQNERNTVVTKITVLQQVESLTITGKTDITMYVGSKYPITIAPNPVTANTTDFSWNISNNIAKFQSTDNLYTRELKALIAGKATFEIVANDKNKASITGTITVKELVIPDEIVLYTGDTYSLTAMTSDKQEQSVNWAISGDCATIDKTSGSTIVITGEKNGEATLSATTTDADANVTFTCKIKVVDIDLSVEKDVIYINETSQLTAKINGVETACTWTSSDNNIATVSSNGLVKGVNVGKVTITATSVDGSTASVEITVKKAVSSIELNKQEIVIYVGASYNGLVATALPADASDVSVKTTSQLVGVSTNRVDNNTYMTIGSRKPGKDVLIVSANDGKGAFATCDIYVKNLSISHDVMSMNVGETKELRAWATCLTDEDIVGNWTVADSTIASITLQDGTAVSIKALAPGETTVTVTTTDGDVNVSRSCKIIVKQPVDTILLNASELTLAKNRSAQLNVIKIRPDNATNKTVTWSSSNKSIVDLVADNLFATILGKEVGSATITVSANDGSGASATCLVTVTESDPNKFILYKGTTKKVEIDPFSGLEIKETTWKSSDSTIVSIQNGTNNSAEFIALKIGTATITANSIEASNGLETTTTFKVQVKELSIPSTITMYKDTNYTLTAGSEVVEWKTSDYSTVGINTTQSEEVVLTANKTGTAIITATTVTADANVSKECVVTVKEFALTDYEHSMAVGETFTLSAMSNGQATTVKWNIDNDCVTADTTDSSTLNISAVKAGTAIITATTTDGIVNISKTCKIRIHQPVTKLVMKNSLTIYVGEPTKLKVTCIPSNASNMHLTWTGYDESMITIVGSTDATVTGLKCGETVLTAEAADGYGATASCIVTIKQRVSKIELPSEHTMYVGNSTTLDYVVLPDNASNQTVTWTSSNTSVATVHANTGLIKALKAGETTITCKATDGGNASATCKLIVKQFVEQIVLKKDTMDIYTNYEDSVHTAKIEISEILPENIGQVELYWESSNTSYITVDQEGVITVQVSALPNNLSYINVPVTCYALDGSGVFATCIVTLKQHASEILLIDYEQFFVIEEGIIVGLTDYAREKLANANIAIDIPQTIGGQTIIGIADEVFMNCTNLTQIIIPSTVDTIGMSTFNGCVNLSDIYIMRKFNEVKNTPWGATTAIIHWLDVTIDASKAQDFIITADNRHLIGWTDSTTTLEIPDYFYDIAGGYYRVVGIGNNAFDGCMNLTDVIIPNTITTIGDYTFANCASLNSIKVNISNEVITIGKYAFYNDTNLKTVDFGDNIITSVGVSAFENCSSLTSLSFNENIQVIGANAFNGCTALKTVTIDKYKDDVTGSPWNAPETTKIIWKNVTDTELAVDVVITKEHWSAMGFSDTKTEFKIPEYFNTDDGSGTLYHVVGIGDNAFADCIKLQKLTLPNSITSIGNSAFVRCSSLSTINIPTSVQSIGDLAFSKTAITGVVIPDSVTTLGQNVFTGCSSLTDVKLGRGLKQINIGLFADCTMLKSVIYEYNITAISDYAFINCVNLTTFNISSSIKMIGNYAFSSCINLQSVSIGSGIELMYNNAFTGCKNLSDIYIDKIENSVSGYQTKWGATNATIHWKKYTEFIVTASNRSVIGYTGKAQEELVIPDYFTDEQGVLYKVTTIDANAFKACTNLRSVSIPETVNTIGRSAFADCTNLMNVTLNEGIKTISTYAFQNCHMLTSITLPASLIGFGDNTLSNNTLLAEIQVASGNANYKSIDGVLFTANGKTLIKYPQAKTGDYVVPETVTSIYAYAFQNCNKLTGITMPSGLESIGAYAFANCSGVTELRIPSTITSIVSTAFYNMTKLTDIWIAKTTNAIANAPWGATSATVHWIDTPTELVITADNRHLVYEEGSTELVIDGYLSDENGFLYKVIGIDDFAFYGCQMETVEIGETVQYIGQRAFAECDKIITVTLSNGLTTIGDGAFENCFNLESVNIPDTVIEIGNESFAYNYCLETVIVPDSVTTIGDAVFADSGIVEIVLGSGVDTLQSNIFENCSALKSIYIRKTSDEAIADSPWGAVNANVYYLDDIIQIEANSSNISKMGYDGGSTLTIPKSFTDKYGFSYEVTAIAENGFLNNTKGFNTVIIADGIKTIKPNAFKNCRTIESVTLPNDLTTLGANAFYGCSKLTSIVVPGTVENIAEGTFAYCNALYSAKFESGVKTIASNVFNQSVVLTEIYIPRSITSIASNAFVNTPDLTDVYVDVYQYTLSGYETIWGADTDKVTITWATPVDFVITASNRHKIGFSESLDELTIPEWFIDSSNGSLYRVAGIDDNAFNGCENLATVVMPNTITTIGEAAFANCRKLTSISLSDNLTAIPNSLFADDDSLSSIYIPDNVISIGDYAFVNTAISDVSFGNNSKLEYIGKYSFAGCWELLEVVLPNSVRTIDEYAFAEYGAPAQLELIALGPNVVSIADNAFDNSMIETIMINQSEGYLSGAPWGAINSDIEWDTKY